MQKIQVPVVMALIKNDNGEVLAQVRNEPGWPQKHNKWEITGGKIESDETPEQAIVREVKEETGFDVEVISLYPKVFTQFWIVEADDTEWQCIFIVYICKIVGGELFNPSQDPKISELRFITYNEIEALEWGSDIDKNLLLEFSKQ